MFTTEKYAVIQGLTLRTKILFLYRWNYWSWERYQAYPSLQSCFVLSVGLKLYILTYNLKIVLVSFVNGSLIQLLVLKSKTECKLSVQAMAF